MARPSTQDTPFVATPEQVCMLGLYAVGASLLSTMHQSLPFNADEGHPFDHDFGRKSSHIQDDPFAPKQMHTFPSRKSKQGKRKGKSLDLLSDQFAVPPPRQMHDFSFNATRLGITGNALPAEMPPSPLSSRVELPVLQEKGETRSKGWLHYLTPSWTKSQPEDEQADREGQRVLKKQRSWSRLPSASTSRREQRSGSDPDTSSTYVPARLGHVPFLPRDGQAVPPPRARSMSLDVPRLARKSMSALRSKMAPPAKDEPAPRLAQPAFLQDRDYHNWSGPGLQVDLTDVPLSDLPRESTSSSESDYSYDRRHSISGSSGHEGLHARARGHSGGSFASMAPSTANESDSDDQDSDDDEDDIEWERPSFRPTLDSFPASPCANRGQGRSSFQVGSGGERPRLPSFASYSKSPSKDGSKVSFGASMLRGGPRRVTSASSLGGKSAESGRSSFSERARRSFSQARTLLTVPSPRSAAARRRSTADHTARPAAVFLQPINTGVISRLCQTRPNPVPSSRSNSMSMTCSTTNTVYGGSVRYPSFYLGTSSESGSVTGGSSGNSSGGRSWESTAPELAALEELVLTECKYLADLQLLLDVYVEGLRRMGLMTPASLEKIVLNLDEVMAFSKFLIDTIRAFLPKRMSPPTSISSRPSNSHDGSSSNQPQQLSEPDYLGLSTKLVKELPARMEVYARYCVAHHGAKERLASSCWAAFGCLAKEYGKRRTDSDELREENEDAEVAHQSEQRQERAGAIYSNWIRLRDVSASICGLTNLAISYQQQPGRPKTGRGGPRPSTSSPLLSSPSRGVPFGSVQMVAPPPPALVTREQQGSSAGLKPAPALTEQDVKPRSSTFSLSAWRRSSAAKVSDKGQADSAGVPSASSSTVSGATPSLSTASSSSSSSGSSSSLLSRFAKAFRHPTA
ncbi:hypothetical protein [Sporisorium scitamineum]|uniref:DH domain-containing protein n=1 Tax=Sporisorium scitamineum TaxID=49012 RepID=A0A0F7RUM6_9BASI|nr:hypothetical protein [Sporisorium scitamineum]